MNMTPRLRSFALLVHVTSSVGWIGAVLAYLALAIAALNVSDTLVVRAAWLAMECTGWYAIVPLALASLLSGLVQSLGTAWGLFRHWWVLMKFLITVFATAILLLHMPDVSYLAGVAAEADTSNLRGLGSDLVHAGAGLLVLLVTVTLGVYKPRGLTRYGWRKQQERQRVAADAAAPLSGN